MGVVLGAGGYLCVPYVDEAMVERKVAVVVVQRWSFLPEKESRPANECR